MVWLQKTDCSTKNRHTHSMEASHRMGNNKKEMGERLGSLGRDGMGHWGEMAWLIGERCHGSLGRDGMAHLGRDGMANCEVSCLIGVK